MLVGTPIFITCLFRINAAIPHPSIERRTWWFITSHPPPPPPFSQLAQWLADCGSWPAVSTRCHHRLCNLVWLTASTPASSYTLRRVTHNQYTVTYLLNGASYSISKMHCPRSPPKKNNLLSQDGTLEWIGLSICLRRNLRALAVRDTDR